jgi:hypothetical protein
MLATHINATLHNDYFRWKLKKSLIIYENVGYMLKTIS